MRGFKTLAFACSVFAISACSSGEQSSSTSNVLERIEANPVIAVMGGFNSCMEDADGNKTPRGSERWVNAEAVSAEHARGEALWVRSCFDMWGWLYYITSDAPDVVYYTHISEPTPLFDAIESLTAGQGEQHPVYLLGHSYGGWLAMYAGLHLPSTAKVRLLYTVDPISPAHCTPANYLSSIAQPGNTSTHLAGCRRAPTDFTQEYRGMINARLAESGWRHYYQLNFSPLHSGAYVDAAQPAHSYDVSPFLGRGGSRPSWNAHAAIDDLSMIWYSFKTAIGSDLGV